MGTWLTSGVNDGYPTNTDNTVMPIDPFTSPYPRAAMHIDGVTNGGYPYLIGNTSEGNCIISPFPHGIMRVDGETNDGYPFLFWQYVPHNVISRPDRLHLIRVFAADATGFTTNGIRIIQPLSCTVTEELNGAYETELEMPVDDSGDWTSLQRNAILKIPIRQRDAIIYQLFRVYRVVSSMSADGALRRKVYARHIFYDLSDVLMDDVRPTGLNGLDALGWLLDHPFTALDLTDDVASKFTAYSDIETIATSYFEGVSLTSAIIGADNCIINRWGGELYRDNYYFSVCTSKEHSKQNCFEISYGIDMTDIEEDIDYSDYASYLVADAGNGTQLQLKYENPATSKPHHTVRYARFNYDVFDMTQFTADAWAYFDTIKMPSVSYRVSFAKLRGQALYDGFTELQNCEVGDTGSIRNRALDISTTQRITKRTYDPLTDTVLSVDTGNTRGSLTRKQPYSSTVTTGQTAAERQMAAMASKTMTTHVNMMAYTHEELTAFNHQQIGGERN